MKIPAWLVFNAVCVLLASCLPPVVPAAVAACPAACEQLRTLGCEAGRPTPEGATCETVCDTTERSEYATGHPACVAVATTCEEAERVSREGCQ